MAFLRPTTIVLAADDASTLERLPRLLQDQLEGEDFRVVTARRAREALDLVAMEPAGRRLVVLAHEELQDGRTGGRLLEDVRGSRPDAVRLLYGARMDESPVAPGSLTVPDAFLQKPERPDDLLQPLLAILGADHADTRPPPRAHAPGSSEAADPRGREPAPAASSPRAPPVQEAPGERMGDIPDHAYRHLVTSVIDYAIFMLDAGGHIRSWSPAARRMKGYEPGDILGKHFSVFYPAEDLANRKPQFELKVASREGRYEDYGWRVRKDGTMFWANVVITALRGPEGELQGFVKVTRDLTERKHAEEALRQSEARYRLLVGSVKDYAIFMLDPEGRIMSWNEGAQRIKGYSAEEVIGEHFSLFYTQAEKALGKPDRELRVALKEGRFEEEGLRVRKDGTTFWANVVLTPLVGSRGEHHGFAKVTRDLTVRKAAEERLQRQAREYQDLNRELESFSYTVAHDLRAPLRAVMHLTDVLREDDGRIPDSERKDVLRDLHRSAERMAQLVEDLLNLSRASKSEIRSGPVDLTALARDVAHRLPSHVKRDGVEVRIQDGLAAHGDERLLRVVLENLLGNAYKFTRQTGAPCIEVGLVGEAGSRAFYVRDNGVGFDPVQAGRLFRPFQRLHAPNEYEGTGIGLATVHRIVHRHGGDIWAEASPGKGATIYFTLPAEPGRK